MEDKGVYRMQAILFRIFHVFSRIFLLFAKKGSNDSDNETFQNVVNPECVQCEPCSYCDGTGIVGSDDEMQEFVAPISLYPSGLRNSNFSPSSTCPICKGRGFLKTQSYESS